MTSLFLAPSLDFTALILMLVLIRIGDAAVRDRVDLQQLGARLGWLHGGLAGCVMLSRDRPQAAEDLLYIVLRSLLAGGLGWGAWLIALPIFAAIYAGTIGALWLKWKQFAHRLATRLQAARHSRPLAPVSAPLPPETESERRDRERELAEIQAVAAERLIAARRREEARLRSELLYERHARQLALSFPRERFEQFVERYMGPGTAPEMVEQRELFLKEMMVDSLGTTTAPKFSTMTDLAVFFEARRQEIEQLPHDEQIKDTYRTQLNRQEDEALRKFLRP